MRFNLFEKILFKLLKKYSFKIYRMGINDYFNWINKDK